MNTYEIFTENFSKVIQAETLYEALKIFSLTERYNAIAVVQVNHHIHKEFMQA